MRNPKQYIANEKGKRKAIVNVINKIVDFGNTDKLR